MRRRLLFCTYKQFGPGRVSVQQSANNIQGLTKSNARGDRAKEHPSNLHGGRDTVKNPADFPLPCGRYALRNQCVTADERAEGKGLRTVFLLGSEWRMG